MPSRYDEGDYPNAYQGQEKDNETGMEAFELRLWDARIGRWLTTDPYRQYHSPYMGMDNNPVSSVDNNGGCTDCNECPGLCNEFGKTKIPNGSYLDIVSGDILPGSTVYNEVWITNSYSGWNDIFQSTRNDFWQLQDNRYMRDFYRGRGELGKDVLTIIGVGISPIAIVELAPIIYANARLSTKGALGKAGLNLTEQTFTQALSEDGSLGNINFLETAISAFTPSSGKTLTNEVLGSSFSLTINDGFKLNRDAVVDFTVGKVMGNVHTKIDGLFPSNAKGSLLVYKQVLKSASSILTGAFKGGL